MPEIPAWSIAPPGAQPVGYAWLVREAELEVVPYHRASFVASSARSTTVTPELTREVFPASYAPEPTFVAHLDFALRHEGIALGVLRALFAVRPACAADLHDWLDRQPTSKNARKLAYLWEGCTGRTLDHPGPSSGNYVSLLDPDEEFTGPPRRNRRWRVIDNLLGPLGFSPQVRQTPALLALTQSDLSERIRAITRDFDADTIARAIAWLYTKETRYSFAIERERPSASRTERFVALLHEVPRLGPLDAATLVRLQNATVDGRFADAGWRTEQVYVGESVGFRQRVHYMAPRPADVAALMDGWLALIADLESTIVHPVIAAAVASFSFVFVHPFRDGNGRLHRFLIHYLLTRKGLVPDDLILPVSAVLHARPAEYDAALETFSRGLMPLLDYDIDANGVATVTNDTIDLYRHPDLTRVAEALFGWVEQTVQTELRSELEYVVRFRAARAAIAGIVDLPDSLATLLVAVVTQNRGRLSATKRKSHFHMLTDAEVHGLEEAIRGAFGLH